MALEFTFVPHGYLHQVVPAIIPLFKRSEFWTRGRASIDDILRFLFTGDMHLWIGYEDDFSNIKFQLITEIKQYPKAKMFVVQYCSGVFGVLDAASDLVFETLERAAIDSGCDGIEFFGRPGWGVEAKKQGYSAMTVVYEKHFSREGEPE